MRDVVARRSWFIILIVALLFCAIKLQGSNTVQTSVFDMFASETKTPALDIALNHATKVFERDLIVVVEANSDSEARQTSQALITRIETFPTIEFIDSTQRVSYLSELFSHRQQLITEQDRAIIAQGQSDQLSQNALRRLYSPAAINGQSFLSDPWQTFERYLLELVGESSFEYQDGMLIAHLNNKTQIMLQLSLVESAYSSEAIEDISQLNQFILELKTAKHQTFSTEISLEGSEGVIANQEFNIYRTGAGFYSVSAMTSAQAEISIIGGGALLLIIAVVLWLFAQFKPLGMTILSLGSGVLLGLAATLACFGQVHAFALVMGSSLIGLAFDYAFHYLSYQVCCSDHTHSAEVGRKLRPALIVGMVSSIIAYGCLFFANLPILNQLAVFSAFGLMGALATVLLFYPAFGQVKHSNRAIIVAHQLTRFVTQYFKPKYIGAVVALCAVIAVVAMFRGYSNDDVRILQSPEQQLVQEEAYIKQLFGSKSGSDWIITIGDDLQQIAQDEERLTANLNILIDQGTLTGYTSSTQWVPSIKRQTENWNLYKALLDQQGAYLATRAGMNQVPQLMPFVPLDKLNDQAGMPRLIGELPEGGFFSLTMLDGLKANIDSDVLSENQFYLNYVDDIGNLLGEYREHVTKLLGVAIGLVIIFIFGYFGRKNLLRLILPPILAVVLAATLPAALGLPITLFNVLGLFLIFGIGIDYCVFLLCHGEAEHTILAVFIAGISSLLSFGLMALSSNYAISSFGMTIGIGILSCWLVAPMVLVTRSSNEE
ncbi:MMPL family transporter [Vibrio sp. WJH972]